MPISSLPANDAQERPRVLVVDDEAVIREVLADFLQMEGFTVETAGDGDEALVALSRQHFDVVLSDLKMPNFGGLELLEAIQRHTPTVVTIIMTGFGTVESAITAMKRGAYDYILKPFKVDEVMMTIRRALERQKLRAENLRLRETLSLFKVSEAIAASLSLEDVIKTITSAAIDEIEADLVSVLLDDGHGGWFERSRLIHPRLTAQGELGVLDPRIVIQRVDERERVRINGTKCLGFFSTQPEVEPHSLIATPLEIRGRVVGALTCVSYTPGKRFDEGQRKLLRIVGNRAAAAIENARLYEDLQSTFTQTIEGLAKAIDKMDRYTAGHSERVAAYAQILAIKLGLDEAQVEIARQSALMHDIGKIGCVMNLNKAGRLSENEYEEFKLHPVYGRDILEPITFLHPLIPGVHLHHERWDGDGYPLGLSKQDIPLIARIVSVADAYDAMTSDRAYRRALPKETAVREVRRCAGAQFDPEIADQFLQTVEDLKAKSDDGEPPADASLRAQADDAE